MVKFCVEQDETGLSVGDFLQRRIPTAPGAYLRQLLKKGKVAGAGGTLSADHQLRLGEEVFLPESARLCELLAAPRPVSGALTILYESREILVIDKPAALAIHSSLGHEGDNLTVRVEQRLQARGSKFKTAPVHRLDLETSGPVLFGKGKKACGELGQLFMRHEVEKYYLALVAGKTAGSGRLESTLKAKEKEKLARTDFRALIRNERASLLELKLHTGRQHQIRQQLAECGHPLYGDQRYRGPCPTGLPRMFLHCCRLCFVDPFSGVPVAIDSPLPAELSRFLPRVGISLSPSH